MLPIDPALLAFAVEQGLLPGERPRAAAPDTITCAKCGAAVTSDRLGWWLDDDGESFCPEDNGGHRPADL